MGDGQWRTVWHHRLADQIDPAALSPEMPPPAEGKTKKNVPPEKRGGRFELEPDGGFRVIPPSVLTADDTAFLRARDEARQVLEYQADDSHLFRG